MSVAKTYAKALYETIRDTKGESFETVDSQLGDFAKLLETSKDARVVLCGPMVASKEKVAVIEEISKKASFSPLVDRFLVLLAKKGRLGVTGEIRAALQAAKLESEGGVLGRVVAADPVEQGDVDTLAQAFSKKLGKKVAFQVSTDPSLLAGMKVTVNGVTYDGTLRSQLQRLRDQVTLGH